MPAGRLPGMAFSKAHVVPPNRRRGGLPDERRAIIGGALRLFARDGYTRTSIDALAAGAGVSTGTVYHHFRDKGGSFAIGGAGERRAAEARGGVRRWLVSPRYAVFSCGCVRSRCREDLADGAGARRRSRSGASRSGGGGRWRARLRECVREAPFEPDAIEVIAYDRRGRAIATGTGNNINWVSGRPAC